MDPDPGKLFRMPTGINLIIKEISDSCIIEGHSRLGTCLTDKNNVFDEPGMLGIGNPKAPHFGGSPVTQVNQFGPGIRAKLQ